MPTQPAERTRKAANFLLRALKRCLCIADVSTPNADNR